MKNSFLSNLVFHVQKLEKAAIVSRVFLGFHRKLPESRENSGKAFPHRESFELED